MVFSIFSDGQSRLNPERIYFVYISPDPVPEVYADVRSAVARIREIDRNLNFVRLTKRKEPGGEETEIWANPRRASRKNRYVT